MIDDDNARSSNMSAFMMVGTCGVYLTFCVNLCLSCIHHDGDLTMIDGRDL